MGILPHNKIIALVLSHPIVTIKKNEEHHKLHGPQFDNNNHVKSTNKFVWNKH
jgi:hypothetical protein